MNRNLDDSSIGTTQEAEIISDKLQSTLNRLNSELNNYLRNSQDPDHEEISEITTTQLEAEDLLCEINVKIKARKSSVEGRPQTNRDSELYSNSKLPKLSLAEFHGDILNFTTFFDQFNSSINNRNLSNVDKLLYLKSSLKGEAAKTIEGLEVTNSNYDVALEILKNRYGKTSHIIDAHYAALYRIKPSTSGDITELRQTFNDIERHLRVLKSLNEDIDHNHLRFMIMEKFPKDIIYELKVRTNIDSIEEMRKTLDIIITAKEDAERATQINQAESYTTQTLHTSTPNNNNHRKFISNDNWKGRRTFNNKERRDTKHGFRNEGRENIIPKEQTSRSDGQYSTQNYKKNIRFQNQAKGYRSYE